MRAVNAIMDQNPNQIQPNPAKIKPKPTQIKPNPAQSKSNPNQIKSRSKSSQIKIKSKSKSNKILGKSWRNPMNQILGSRTSVIGLPRTPESGSCQPRGRLSRLGGSAPGCTGSASRLSEASGAERSEAGKS